MSHFFTFQYSGHKLHRLLLLFSIFFGTVSLLALANDGNNMLNLNMKTQPKTFDPRKACDVFSSQMAFLLFEGLLKQYPDGSVQPAIAKTYQISDDRLTYTFTLKDCAWSNGKPITAYDFEQSWKDILHPDFPTMCDYAFYSIKNAQKAKRNLIPLDQVGIKALDAKTLVVTLERPTPYFIKLLCLPPFFAINIAEDRRNPKWIHQTGAQYVCSGPFILDENKEGHKIILGSNPYYRKTSDVHPEKIVFNIVENNQVSLEMFKKGSIDMIGDSLTDIPLGEISELEKKWKFYSEAQPHSVFIYLNTDMYPFNNNKIRKAFGLAINRRDLLELLRKDSRNLVYSSSNELANKAVLFSTNIIPPCLKENRHQFFFKDNDVAEANKLLTEGMNELGITKDAFKSLSLLYSSRIYASDEIVQIIQQQLARAFGIFIKLEKLDFSVMLDKLRSKNYYMSLSCWTSFYCDPMNVFERFKYKTNATNYCCWENKKFSELLDRSDYEEGNKRLETLEEAERVMINDMPVIPLYHRDYLYLMNPNMKSKISLWGDRILLPLSLEEKKAQKENKTLYKK